MGFSLQIHLWKFRLWDIGFFHHIKYGDRYFFDSFGQPLSMYGLDIALFFNTYNGNKIKVFNSPLQDDISYVCGAYTIYFAYIMSKNYSTYYIKTKFSKNKKRNDSLMKKFIFLKTGTQITCNSRYCSSFMFQINCRV